MGERWWEAKVLEVDAEGSEVLVHFTGRVIGYLISYLVHGNNTQDGMEDTMNGLRWIPQDCNLFTGGQGMISVGGRTSLIFTYFVSEGSVVDQLLKQRCPLQSLQPASQPYQQCQLSYRLLAHQTQLSQDLFTR